jgi:hypothetical protein
MIIPHCAKNLPKLQRFCHGGFVPLNRLKSGQAGEVDKNDRFWRIGCGRGLLSGMWSHLLLGQCGLLADEFGTQLLPALSH